LGPLFLPPPPPAPQGLSPSDYEAQKEAVADEVCGRLEALWPGLRQAVEFREVGSCRAGLAWIWLGLPADLTC